MARSVYGYLAPGSTPGATRAQRAAVEAFCAGAGLGAALVHLERESSRERFAALLAAVQPGDVIVLPAVEALGARVPERAGRLLALLAAEAEVRCADGTPPLAALREAWTAGETYARRQRAREGMRRRALRGLVLGRPPYGYAVEERRLVPDAREAEVVRRIFADYLEGGEGIRRIAARLNADGIRTRRGKAWVAGSVRAILRNPVYTGLYRRLGVAVPRAHEALVSRERFREVGRRMERRRTAPSEQHRETYLLAGLVRCGSCGGRMIGARRPIATAEGEERRYYRCASRTNEGRCAYWTWRAEDLEAEVRRLLASDVALPVAARIGRPRDAIAASRERLERVVAAMLDRWVAGEWTDYDFQRRGARAATGLARLDSPAPAPAAAEEARRRLAAEWESLEEGERRALLVSAVGEVTVRGDEVRLALAR